MDNIDHEVLNAEMEKHSKEIAMWECIRALGADIFDVGSKYIIEWKGIRGVGKTVYDAAVNFYEDAMKNSGDKEEEPVRELRLPFDISYRSDIESGECRVETADGLHKVRIICWDAEGSQRNDDIIGLEKGTLGAENIQRYDVTGHLIADSSKRGNRDLVIVINQ